MIAPTPFADVMTRADAEFQYFRKQLKRTFPMAEIMTIHQPINGAEWKRSPA